MIDYARRGAGALALLAMRRDRRNRLAQGTQPGVRIAALHAEDTDDLTTFKRFIEAASARFTFAGPEVVDRVAQGYSPATDAVVLSFDDGHARTFEALTWLARQGLRVLLFVIPSYMGRSAREYFAWHASRGVAAYNIAGDRDLDATRGLEPSQLRELEDLGHRIGGHNDAHRDLGALEDTGAAYEIDRGLERLEEILGHAVDDFAWAFGRRDTITPDAAARARQRCARVFSSVRGINVPGATPALLLRDHVSLDFPFVFNVACLRGAFDDRYADDRRALATMQGLLARGEASSRLPA